MRSPLRIRRISGLILLLLGSAWLSLALEPQKTNQNVTPDSTSSSSSCPKRCLGNLKTPVAGARIFYLILVHNERIEDDALHLFRAIRDPRNTIVVHYDTKMSINSTSVSKLRQEMSDCPCGSTVHAEAVHSVEWSKWSMNLPTLWGMKLAVTKYYDDWDVFVNLSGDTLPVYTPNTIATTIDALRPYNFVTSKSCETGLLPTNVYQFPKSWHKRRHYTRQDESLWTLLTVSHACCFVQADT